MVIMVSGVCSQLSAGLRVCDAIISRWRPVPGAPSLTPLSSLSPLASGHDDWRPGARRGEQTWSAEGGGGAPSVRGVTSQQSGVMRVMIPVRVVITRQMAAPEIKHPLTPSEVTHWVTFSQTSNKTHSKYLHCDKSDMLM